MVLVEQHLVMDKGICKEIDNLMWLSKNLYNYTLYHIRQHYFKTDKWLTSKEIYLLMRETKDYRALPDKVSKGTIRKLDDNIKSSFQAIKSYNKTPEKFTGKPKIPKYLNTKTGRFMVSYEKDAINHKTYKKDGRIMLSKTNIWIKPKAKLKDIKTITLTKQNNTYTINISYEKKEKVKRDLPVKHASIDLGVNNIVSLCFEHTDNPLIYDGRILKSINQGWNKRNAKLKSELSKGVYSSLRIKKETDKRNRRVSDFLHKLSRDIVNQLVSKNITDLIIGYNVGWKQDINLGKVNNQKFVNIPYLKLVNMLKYKCFLEGINVILTEESYTSKCSFIDNEPLKKQEVYLGNRKHRGLFISNKGLMINADVNGSYNILRKVVSQFKYGEGIVALIPTKILVG